MEIMLILAYAIPLVFLIWLWLHQGMSVRVKLFVSLLLPLFYGLHWQGLQDYRGWPASQALPERFELIAADVVEPTPDNQQQGHIYLWLRLTDDGQPRAYGLPYSRKLHSMLFETKKRVAAGFQQVGLLRSEDQHGGNGAEVGYGNYLEFVDMPKQALPPKP